MHGHKHTIVKRVRSSGGLSWDCSFFSGQLFKSSGGCSFVTGQLERSYGYCSLFRLNIVDVIGSNGLLIDVV